MKRTLMVTVILSVVLLGTFIGAYAYTSPRMRVNVGFSFYADNQLLPAGEYWFEIRPVGRGTLAGSPMAIRSVEGNTFQYLPATAVGSQRTDEGAYVVFSKVGGAYFLSRIQQGSLEGSLPKSRSEKEIKTASQITAAAEEIVTVAAAR